MPAITSHADGGVTMSLPTGWTGEPSRPDLVEEATAVAIGRAYQKAEPGPHRVERARIAGIIAGHQMVQNAELQTMSVTHGETVAEWRRTLKTGDRASADDETRAIVDLARRIETDLALPRTSREMRQWDERRSARAGKAPAPDAGAANQATRDAQGGPKTPEATPVRRAGAAPGGGDPRTARRGPAPQAINGDPPAHRETESSTMTTTRTGGWGRRRRRVRVKPRARAGNRTPPRKRRKP